jgi:hypothetical protein
MNLLAEAEVGDQERREQVHDVADARRFCSRALGTLQSDLWNATRDPVPRQSLAMSPNTT